MGINDAVDGLCRCLKIDAQSQRFMPPVAAVVQCLPGQADAQIAAISWARRAIVATRNTVDFADTGATIINPFDS